MFLSSLLVILACLNLPSPHRPAGLPYCRPAGQQTPQRYITKYLRIRLKDHLAHEKVCWCTCAFMCACENIGAAQLADCTGGGFDILSDGVKVKFRFRVLGFGSPVWVGPAEMHACL